MLTTLVYLVLYAGGMVFLAGSVIRAVGYAKQPIHLRWEIYPVPKGTSGQLRVMVPEMLFLKGLHEFNRSLWYISYPFHLGLYLIAAAAALSFLTLSTPAGIAGIAGLVLVLAGSLGLLVRRLSNRTWKIYTTAGDILNLAWFAATAALLLAGYLWRPAGSAGPLAILGGAVTFDTTLEPAPLLAAGLISGALLLAYIPMTHMAHFIAKYFTYHAVRWDERDVSLVQSRMAEYLTYRPTWSAGHIQADGNTTWAEIAGRAPGVPQGGKK